MASQSEHILLICCNPDPFCIATESLLARSLRKQAVVSAINLNYVLGSVSHADSLRDFIYEWLDNKYRRFIIPELNGDDYTVHLDTTSLPVIPSLPCSTDHLRSYQIDGVNVGLSALSTAASYAKCVSPLSADYGSSLRRAWLVAHLSYYVGLSLLHLPFSAVYIFNGRFAISRPISEVFAKRCKVFFYEADSFRRSYFYSDRPIYSPSVISDLILQHAPNISAGTRFFRDSLYRRPNTASAQFASHQISGSLPDALRCQSFVCFFTSSPDEFFAISDDTTLSPSFRNQYHLASTSSRICAHLGKKFVVRFHPHLCYKHPSWRDEWDFSTLLANGTLLIQPDDPTDSYSLLLASESILTCGSTIGIEAAFHGIPSAVVGDSITSRIGCATLLSTYSDLYSFLSNPSTLSSSYQAALRYGSYASSPTGSPIHGLELRNGCYLFEGRLISLCRSLTLILKTYSYRALSFVRNHFA